MTFSYFFIELYVPKLFFTMSKHYVIKTTRTLNLKFFFFFFETTVLMTVQQILKAPSLDSPEKTAYSGAPRDIGRKVHGTNVQSSAVLGHKLFSPGSGGRKATLCILPFKVTTSSQQGSTRVWTLFLCSYSAVVGMEQMPVQVLSGYFSLR